MTRLVVDASVAVKWFIPENDAQAATRVLRKGHALLAPDLIWAEVGNVFWKKWRRDEIAHDEAHALLRDFRRFPLEITSSQSLLAVAWHIATQSRRSLYDSLYLALAETHACRVVTADRRLFNALR
ncbi:MAG: type II toxin-antitoxin system VapC family toxin, partial [Nitrospirales bacterium]